MVAALVISDVNKDLTFKAKDQDKGCILVLKESLRTRTRTNITARYCDVEYTYQ